MKNLEPAVFPVVDPYAPLYDGIQRKPYDHQKEALPFAEDKPCIILLWEMGTGKTGGAILIARLRYSRNNRLLRTLIVTPPVTIANWKDEFGLWSKIDKSLIHAMVQNGGDKKAEYMYNRVYPQMNGAVVITNYEALLSENFFKSIEQWNPELLIMDEGHYVKNPKAKRSKLVQRLAEKTQYVTTLTGTPILKDVRDVFGIFRAADRGATFGKNPDLFTYKYMYDENRNWKGRSGYFPKWKNNEAAMAELTTAIYKKALRKLKSECLDLPPLVKITKWVPMGKVQKKAYDEMYKNFMLFIESHKAQPITVTANLAIVKALRLMQIATGFVTSDLGEEIIFDENPRLDLAAELLEELTPNHKVIVWCSFKCNYRMIEAVCKKLGVNYVMLTGEQDTKEKGESVYAFQSDPNVRVIIANRASGGVGVNLTAADYSIVYSRNFSLAEELQSEARNHRGGSEVHEQIVKIDLACENTIEEGVLAALADKLDISTKVIDIVKEQRK